MSIAFKAVGLPVQGPEEYAAFLRVAGQAGEWVQTKRGYLIHWGPDQGVEFWGQADAKRQLIGGSPHFIGSGRIRMAISRVIPSSPPALDGIVVGMVDPDERGEGGSYPVAVALSDFDVLRDLLEERGLVAVLQVVAFAESIHVYTDDADYDARAEVRGLATEAAIPIGTFRPDGSDIEPPQPRILFTGHIEQAELRHNSFGGAPFWVLSVKTLGGWFDVVADPQMVNGTPTAGGVVAGTFQLSAQLFPDERLASHKLPPVHHEGFNHPSLALRTPHGLAVLERAAAWRGNTQAAGGAPTASPPALPAIGGRLGLRARIFLTLVAVVCCWFAGQSIYTWLTNRHPTVITCADYLRTRPSAKWLELTDCDIDFEGAIQLQSRVLKLDKGSFVPVRPRGIAGPVAIVIKMRTDDFDNRILDDIEGELAADKPTTQPGAPTTVKGLVVFGLESDSKTEKALRDSGKLTADFVIIDPAGKPDPAAALGSVVLLVAMGFVGFVMLRNHRRAGRLAPQVTAEALPPPPLPTAMER